MDVKIVHFDLKKLTLFYDMEKKNNYIFNSIRL